MNESDFPHLHAYRSTAGDDGSPQAAPAVDRNTFIANLHRIGSGAAAARPTCQRRSALVRWNREYIPALGQGAFDTGRK